MQPTRLIGVDGTSLFRAVDGIGRYSANVLRAAAEQSPDWTFLVIGFAQDRSAPSLVPDLPNVRRHFLPIPRRFAVGMHVFGIPLNVRRLLPPLDALVCLNFTLFPVVSGVPTLAIIYDLTYHDHPEVMAARNRAHLARQVPRTVEKASVVGAISAFTAHRITDVYPDHAPVVIVPCGLDERFLTPDDSSASALDLPPRYVLAVGTLEPRKNLVTLIRAYAQLDTTLFEEYPLVIVGRKGWGPNDLPDDIPTAVAEAVRYTGYVEDADLPAVYSGASLFVFPSIYEGFGLPLLEAMACGVPAVASDIETFAEIGSRLVDLVPPTDPAAFAAAITARLAEPDPERTEAARGRARAWTWERSGAVLRETLAGLLR